MEISEILKDHQLNEGQAKLLRLLKHFDSRCREFGITYYLGGGTALGAVRHKGFLPWDDDVDLYISRDQFDKLMSVKDEFFTDDFVLVSYYTFNSYRNVLVRCVDTKSTAITKARLADDAPKGQFVELFIMDPMPVDKQKQHDWLVKHWIYAELMALAFRVANSRIYDWIDYDMYKKYLDRVDKVGVHQVLRELEEELFTIPESEAKEYCSRWGQRNLFYDIDWFGTPRLIPFEDTYLPVPSRAERVLRFDYGDSWMYIPNVDEQIIHSIASDMEIPYKTFIDDIEKNIDRDELNRLYELRKAATVKVYRAKTDVLEEMQKMQELVVRMQYDKLDTGELKALYEAGRYGEVQDMLRTWFDTQYSNNFWTVGHYLDIGDDKLYYALASLLPAGDFSKVLRLIGWREKNGQPLTPELESLKVYSNNVRDTYISIDDKDMEKAKQYIDKCGMSPLHVDQYDYAYLKGFYDVRVKASRGEDLEETTKYIEEIAGQFPERGEIISLLADMQLINGQTEKAIETYAEAFEKTRHGLIRMHIKETLKGLEEGR